MLKNCLKCELSSFQILGLSGFQTLTVVLKNSIWLNCFQIVFQIPAEHVGAVIGRGGENIKEIQRKTKTRIDFKDDVKGTLFVVTEVTYVHVRSA